MRADERAGGGGILEGSARVLRELLRTPRIRETLALLRRELDPEGAPLLVRALAEDRAELLDALALAPRLANAAVLALGELAAQLGSIPPEMLRGVALRLVEEVDAGALGAALGRSLALGQRLVGPDLRGAARRLARDFSAGLRRGAEAAGADPGEVGDGLARALADGIRALGRDDPELLRRVARPVVEAARAALEGDEEATDGA